MNNINIFYDHIFRNFFESTTFLCMMLSIQNASMYLELIQKCIWIFLITQFCHSFQIVLISFLGEIIQKGPYILEKIVRKIKNYFCYNKEHSLKRIFQQKFS